MRVLIILMQICNVILYGMEKLLRAVIHYFLTAA